MPRSICSVQRLMILVQCTTIVLQGSRVQSVSQVQLDFQDLSVSRVGLAQMAVLESVVLKASRERLVLLVHLVMSVHQEKLDGQDLLELLGIKVTLDLQANLERLDLLGNLDRRANQGL